MHWWEPKSSSSGRLDKKRLPWWLAQTRPWLRKSRRSWTRLTSQPEAIPEPPDSMATPDPSWSREEYETKFNAIRTALQRGDIYEMNLCMPWSGAAPADESWTMFERLAANTKAPHSATCNRALRTLCASPERFLAKRGNTLHSQPIKGTVKRGATEAEDNALRDALANSVKEQAENVMIVTVRNDLSRVAERDSVNVDELFGIHSFATVHQMISSVSCTLRPDASPLDIMRSTFPMGSMTGHPNSAP